MSETNATAPGTPQSRAPWLQRLLDEQGCSWRQGERIRVEDLLERHPELRQQPEAVLDLIAQEVLLRAQAGEAAPLAEFQGRFPHLHGQLRDLFADACAAGSQTRGSTLISEPAAPGVGQSAAPPAEGWPAIPGCEIQGMLGRGGMGLVLHGRDPGLGRDLAVKVLRPDHQGDPDVERRFVEEAQIGGQLQHPGIVPVHALGRSADGRPFFTMKLVKGRTLADLLKERSTPAQELPRFLGIFQQVCQTLAYAHSKRVIHRDLKPQNVMVGAFGEVQVMDWGLAKVLGTPEASRGRQPPEEAPSALRTVRTEQSGASSQAGSVLGTPAYMAPEQARGEIDRLDERCDVFGLGAILCEILTGQPPYVAAAGWQVYPKAVAGELTDALARLEGSRAEPELLRLARNCLATNPEDRPRHAGAVAEAVTAYQNSVTERLRQAELERSAAQVKAREERKRRKLAVGLAAAVVGVVLVGGGSAFWLLRQAAERRIELRQGVEAALDKAAELQQQARWGEARAVLDQAEHRLGDSGPADLRRRVRQARADLRLVDRLDAAHLKAATWLGDRFDDAAAERAYATAFRQAGLGQEGDDAAAVAARIRGSAVKGQLVAALDDWAGRTTDHRRRAWLLAVARLADPDQRRNRLRVPVLWQKPTELDRLARQVQLGRLSPQLLAAIGIVLLRQGGNAVPLLTSAQRQYPHDFWLTFNLGTALVQAKSPEEAIGYLRAALALRPTTYAVHINLGVALADKGRLEEAIACFRKALALDPKRAQAHNNLGKALKDKGRLEEAIACFRKALALDPKDAPAHYRLGNVLKAKGDLDRAITSYQKALAINPKYAKAQTNLGVALHAKGDLAGAIACYQKALALDPKDAKAHNNLGIALQAKGELDGAIACIQKALAVDPKYVQAHSNLGIILKKRGELDGAIVCFQKALALDPKFAPAHYNLGAALQAKGRLDLAIACYQQALAIDPKLALAHYNLGNALQAKGRLDLAIASWQKALALNPKYAPAHTNLGIALAAKGDLAGAIACYQKALALNPKYAPAHTNLGAALAAKGELDGAIACYEKALALDPKLAKAQTNLGNALKAKGDLDRAIACYEKALALDPKLALAHGALGQALLGQGRFTEARDSTRRCLQLLPPRHPLRARTSQILSLCERLLVLEAQVPALLQGKTQPASTAERLEYAGLCYYKKLYTAAVRLYAAAFTADPKLADNPAAGHRYNAACCAALAGAGQGNDAGQLDARERHHWRQQALDWLRQDLGLWGKLLEAGTTQARAAVQQRLRHWQRNPNLAGVRDAAWLVNLPDKELQACRQLWADVDALLKRAGEPK
jgi:tetratricopeptide (TPR) repeat protein